MKLTSASLACLFVVGPIGSLAKKPVAPELADYCFYAINTVLGSYTFYDPSSSTTSSISTTTSIEPRDSSSSSSSGHGNGLSVRGSSSTTFCTDTIQVTSLYASARLYCNYKEWKATIPYWESLCKADGVTLMDLTSIEAEVTKAYAKTLPAIDPETNLTTTTGNITSPVRLTRSYYERAHKTYTSKDFAASKNILYGWGLLGFWGVILVLGMIDKAIYTFVTLRRDSQLRKADAEGASPSKAAKLGPWHWVRTHFVIPAGLAPFVERHQGRVIWHTIPRRLDLFIIFSWWAVAIILTCVQYDSSSGNITTPSVFEQNWTFLSKRTGIMMISCLPFVWLFGIRNNPFLWATRFSTRSFNLFHRHVAVVCTVEVFMHAIAYSVRYIHYDDKYGESWQEAYWRWGVVAAILMFLMVATSHAWLRAKSYELFLVFHVVAGVLILYGIWMHLSIQHNKYYYYYWPMVAIWSFERAVRLVRQLYCNLRVKFGKGLVRTTSTISYDESADLVRVEISPAASSSLLYKPSPGQFYYLYQPFTFKGWENHPFTLGAYIKGEGETSDRLIFYIRPHDGWTRQLRDKCRTAKKEGGLIHPSLILEGPYGHGLPMHHFDTQLYVVGGTGIASAVPYIQDYMERSRKGDALQTTKVHLVWSGKQKALLGAITRAEELRGIHGRSDIEITFYCTDDSQKDVTTSNHPNEGSESPGGIRDEKENQKTEATVASLPYDNEKSGNITPDDEGSSDHNLELNILYGRPDVRSIVTLASDEAKASSSSLAVLACGPGHMADDTRAAVHKVMRGGFHNIEYFEEAFGW